MERKCFREDLYTVEQPQPKRFWLGITAVGITVTAGIALAVMAILVFRPPTTVERVVTKLITAPAPPPEVIVKEVIKEVVKEVPVAPPEPPPPVIKIPERQNWEGIWRPKRSQLPMFKLVNKKGIVTGMYAPPEGLVLPILRGETLDNAVEVVVDNSPFRVHFRLSMIDSASMQVIAWITDDDWLLSVARANELLNRAGGNRRFQTPQRMLALRQQALQIRSQLQENIKLTRKPASLGVFYRGSEN